MKKIKIVCGAFYMALLTLNLQAQTNPAAQNLPYNFTALNNGTLPAGMAAHRFGSVQTSRTTANGSGDMTLGSQNNQGGWRNEGNSGISMLASGTQPAGAIVVSINTTGLSNISVSWKASTLLQQASRDNSLALQYRVGTSATWTDVGTVSVYSTTGRADGHVSATLSETLPVAANNQSVVQVRWVYWESAGSSGSRDRIGLDDISITGTAAACTAPSTQGSNFTFNGITANQATINWTNGNGGGRIVMMNAVNNSFSLPTNGSNPTANTVYAGSNSQVIYNGTGSGPITVTNLQPNTNYYFAIFEYCTPNRNYNLNSAGTQTFTTPAIGETITTTGTYGPFCNANASNVNVSFTSSGTFTGTFSAELSNASGSFASPTVIGTGNTSPIAATLPAGLNAGTGYRIRVVNDNPSTEGTNNGSNITINALPVVNLGNDTSYCAGTTFSKVLNAGNAGATYNWNNGASTSQTFTATTAGTYTVEVSNPGGCVAQGSIEITENALPVVNLGNDTSYCTGSAFAVTLDAENAGLSYLWNDNSTDQTLLVTQDGIYSVTVTDANGCVGTDSRTITENALPIVNLGNDTAYCVGATFALTLDAENNGATYLWNDNSTDQTLDITTAGTYSVAVTDINGCVATDSRTITEAALPIVNLGNDTAYCAGSTFTLTLDAENTGATYLWNNNSTDQTLDITTAGTYSVTVTDADGCIGTDQIEVTENILPIVTLGNDTSYCAGTTFAHTLNAGNAGATYLWNDNSTDQSLDITTIGTYSVTVTDANGCTTTDNIEVTEDATPVIDLGADESFCADETVSVVLTAGNPGASYLWSNGLTAQDITAETFGTFWVEVTGANGCISTDTIKITSLALPVINLGNDTSYCSGTNFTLVLDAGNPGAFYLWEDNSENQTLTVDTAGSYAVIVEDANGCSEYAEITITENASPVVNLGNDTAYCVGSAFSLTLDAGNTGASFNWNNGAASTQTYTATEDGTYIVTVTDANGCTGTDNVVVTENALPVIDLGNDISTAAGSHVLDAGAGFSSYAWTPGNQTTQQITVTQNGTYEVTVSDANGCSASDDITVSFTASINDVETKISLQLFPNPANQMLNVRMDYQGDIQLDVVSFNGQRLTNRKVASYEAGQTIEMDLGQFSSGIYFIRLTSSDFNVTKTFVINK